MTTRPPVCDCRRRAVFFVLVSSFLSNSAIRLPAFQAVKIPFGNRVLTMISVWLGAKGRVDSPRFDMLAGEAGPGFGRASHVTENRALALAFPPRPPRFR